MRTIQFRWQTRYPLLGLLCCTQCLWTLLGETVLWFITLGSFLSLLGSYLSFMATIIWFILKNKFPTTLRWWVCGPYCQLLKQLNAPYYIFCRCNSPGGIISPCQRLCSSLSLSHTRFYAGITVAAGETLLAWDYVWEQKQVTPGLNDLDNYPHCPPHTNHTAMPCAEWRK